MDETCRRVAVFRIGHIGDTIVAMPALWTVRKYFPNAEILYFTQAITATANVQGLDVLRRGTVYDRPLAYQFSGGVSKLEILKSIVKLRRERVDALIYLPPARSAAQLDRDAKFFRLAGIKRIIGMQGYRETDYRPKGVPLPSVAHETDILLSHLARDGVKVPDAPSTLLHLGLSNEEKASGRRWLESKGVTSGDVLVGIGPGSKMPAKLWSLDRFRQVVQALDSARKPVFISFGSPAERETCEQVIQGVGRAINSAGELSVRESAAIFDHVALYVGNDTGTMHIASSAGTKCVCLFSARDWPGRWYPYGEGNTVLREFVPCEGCMLEVCDKGNLCLDLITADRVTNAALSTIELAGRTALG